MLGINFLGSFLLEQIGCGDLGGGDDGAGTIGIGNGASGRFGFGADAAAGVVVGDHGLIVIDSEISTAIQLCTCTFFLGPALY